MTKIQIDVNELKPYKLLNTLPEGTIFSYHSKIYIKIKQHQIDGLSGLAKVDTWNIEEQVIVTFTGQEMIYKTYDKGKLLLDYHA